MNQKALETFIKRVAPEIAEKFLAAAKASHNEAELRTHATRIIEQFAEKAGLELELREEYTLFNGRADAVYNRLVIEYEHPGRLNRSNTTKANEHAIDQVQAYMEGLERVGRHKPERLAGVAFDGTFYIFVRERKGSWRIDEPLPVTADSTVRFLRTLASLTTEMALIPENLVRDFGEKSAVAGQVVRTFYEALSEAKSPRANVLFEQWSLQFSEVCDYDKASKLNIGEQARGYGITDSKIEPFAFFFCVHAYYALLTKLLASQIAHFYLMPKVGTDLKATASLDSDGLKRYLEKLEDGGIFHDLGITNFLEGDFFSWYLDLWSPAMDEAVRSVVSTLAYYSLVTLDVDPDATRDLLKNLYQNLMPKKLRHNLGEYYTPDWLAERLLNMLEGGKFTGDPKKRLLDPACGSGTFLALAIKRIRQNGWETNVPEPDLLEAVLENVVGFDLNPLAVISARTNYLLALGDLLQHRRGEITIPVYICDSILTPSEAEGLFDRGACTFDTAVGQFAVPSSLVEAHYIDRLADVLEQAIGIRATPEMFIQKVAAALPVDPEKDEHDVGILKALYAKLLELDDKGVNGIWARIIKNAFAPLFAGRFDYVVGNPPWVNWEHLPEQYRKDIAPLWKEYGLFTHKGLRARMGSGKDDISVLMFYVAADRYLKKKGRIGFVITQTVFKSEGGGAGFRRFKLGKRGPPLRVLWLDDMSQLKPFEGAANRTAVVMAQKGSPTKYPINVGYWRKRRKGVSLPQSAQLTQVMKHICRMSQWKAEPIDSSRIDSPWITGRPKSVVAVKRISGPSDYVARKGATPNLNGVFWVEVVAQRPDGAIVISNRGDIGRNKVETVQCPVEREFVYPLLRGRDTSRRLCNASLHMILPQDPERPSKAVPEEVLHESYTMTWSYFKRFESALRARKSSTDQQLMKSGPFYSVWGVGSYTFARHKVVWKEICSQIEASVLSFGKGEKAVIPDHKLVLVACSSKDEAHYVCALLNSSVANYLVKSYAVTTQLAPHILTRVPIREFDPSNEPHSKLAELSRRAHKAATKMHSETVGECDREIDTLAAELWGLSKAEMKDIQLSLKELME